MANVKVFLKGWRDSQLFSAAVNDNTHPLHEAAWPVYLSSFKPFRENDAVYFAVEYDDDGDDAAICERAFKRFNIGDVVTDDVVRRYRGAGHRSLSVGDVVVVDGRVFTVASFGFEPVERFLPPQVGLGT